MDVACDRRFVRRRSQRQPHNNEAADHQASLKRVWLESYNLPKMAATHVRHEEASALYKRRAGIHGAAH